MTTITSTTIENIEDILEPFEFIFNASGLEKSVTDKDLNSESAALGYATKEFLENGCNVQTVTFQTYARGLNVNDIISIILPQYKIPVDLSKHRFIITGITTEYNGAKTTDVIKGVRYD